MEFKGTKGKWYLQEYTDAYTNIIRCDNGIHNTLYVASTGQSSDEKTRYNALLISKAPEMLEMLMANLNKFSSVLDRIEGSEFENELTEDVVPLMAEIEQLIKEATELK